MYTRLGAVGAGRSAGGEYGAVTSWGVLGVWRELAVMHDKSRGCARGGAAGASQISRGTPCADPTSLKSQSITARSDLSTGILRLHEAGPIGEIACTRAFWQ